MQGKGEQVFLMLVVLFFYCVTGARMEQVSSAAIWAAVPANAANGSAAGLDLLSAGADGTDYRTGEGGRLTNIVLMGIEEEPRGDTICLIILDRESRQISLLSIPRDTYYCRAGYENGDQRKINAAYGRKGAAGVVAVVREFVRQRQYLATRKEGQPSKQIKFRGLQ